MMDTRIATIEVRGFLRASYPETIVRAEYWTHGPSPIGSIFIDESLRVSYPRQRYHRLVHLIPSEYYVMRILRIAFGLS